jgi:hypothetical protein
MKRLATFVITVALTVAITLLVRNEWARLSYRGGVDQTRAAGIIIGDELLVFGPRYNIAVKEAIEASGGPPTRANRVLIENVSLGDERHLRIFSLPMPTQPLLRDNGYELVNRPGADVRLKTLKNNGGDKPCLFVEGNAYAVLIWLEPFGSQKEDESWLLTNVKRVVTY